jgi:hypothetical protein
MKRLSSLVLTLYALGAVVLCLAVGLVLAQVRPYSAAMSGMNHGMLLAWLLAGGGGAPGAKLLVSWFLALCAAVGVLVLNLCACTWTRLLPRLKNGSRFDYWLLILSHVLMILVLLGHLSEMTLGFKEEGVKLLPGQSQTLPGDLRLTVERVHFVNNPGLLNLSYRQARQALTTKTFNRAENTVRIALWQGSQRLASGDLHILEPLQAAGVRLTLTDFFKHGSGMGLAKCVCLPGGNAGPPSGTGTGLRMVSHGTLPSGPEDKSRVGAVLTITYNPLTKVFFAAYLAWIAVYLLLAVKAFLRGGPAVAK